jgi:hypothetical protein
MRERLRLTNVTAGSQVILPAYPGLAVLVGLLFVYQSPLRTQGPAFEMATRVMSTPHWGFAFVLLGVFEVACFYSHRSGWFRWSLIIGAGLCGFWATLLCWSAFVDEHVSWTSCVWVFFAGLAHVASARSVSRDVVFRVPR